MLEGALENGLRGFMVSCGQCSPAHIAEFLCFSLPHRMQAAYLPCAAGGDVKVLSDAATAAAAHKAGFGAVSPAGSRALGPTVGRGAASTRPGSAHLLGIGSAGADRHDGGGAPSGILLAVPCERGALR